MENRLHHVGTSICEAIVPIHYQICLQNHIMCHPPGDNVNRPSLSCSRIIFINLGESVSEGLKGTFPPK